jgi:hypothetical protein
MRQELIYQENFHYCEWLTESALEIINRGYLCALKLENMLLPYFLLYRELNKCSASSVLIKKVSNLKMQTSSAKNLSFPGSKVYFFYKGWY